MRNVPTSTHRRYLVVSIDTEVDQDHTWRIADPPTFASVIEGIPRLLSPLFEKYAVKPTYLLSPEVIEDSACVNTLRWLGDRAELGTHLHIDCIEPHRRLFRHNMAGQANRAIQRQCHVDIEREKLKNLTVAFYRAFGKLPTAFRAGRYGMSQHTLVLLAELGYQVDSSVTPGLRWDYEEGVIDYRQWSSSPVWIHTPVGTILELPLSIRPATWASPLVRDFPELPRRIVTHLLGRRARYQWLRPSWHTGEEMIRYAQHSAEPILVLMLHSMEVIPGASPYAASPADVRRILDAMDALFHYWSTSGHAFCSMTDAVHHVKRRTHDGPAL